MVVSHPTFVQWQIKSLFKTESMLKWIKYGPLLCISILQKIICITTAYVILWLRYVFFFMCMLHFIEQHILGIHLFLWGSHWGVPIPDPAYCFVWFLYPAYTMYVSNSNFFVISRVPLDLISHFPDTIIWLSGVTLTKNRQSRVTLRPQWDPLLWLAINVCWFRKLFIKVYIWFQGFVEFCIGQCRRS